MAIGFMFLYAQLANVLSTQALFYTIIFPFIAFFGAFAFVFYPMKDILHPTSFCDWLLSIIGQRFSAPVAVLRIWSFCLFYVMAELWGSVVVSVLFWGFANQITTVDEAKQFYPLFGLGANVALIFSGRAVRIFSEIRSKLPPGVDGWGMSLKGLMGMVVIGGFLVAGTYWAINNVIIPSLPVSAEAKAADAKKAKKKKVSMPMGESLKYLAESRYVRDLATLVVSYGISINLVEVTWKSKIKAQCVTRRSLPTAASRLRSPLPSGTPTPTTTPPSWATSPPAPASSPSS
jgi:AAA family ATP:ADP antiporter